MESHLKPPKRKEPDKSKSVPSRGRAQATRFNTRRPGSQENIDKIQSGERSSGSSRASSQSPSAENPKKRNFRCSQIPKSTARDTYSSASESDNPRSSITSEDNTTKVEKWETDEESGNPLTIYSANIDDKTKKQPSESLPEKSPPMKKLKQSDKEAEKEVTDSTPAPSDTKTKIPTPTEERRWQATTSLPPPEMDDEQVEATIPPPEVSDSPETAQIDQSIEEREPTEAQNESAQPPCDAIQITATPPPPGLHEAEEPARKTQDIEAVLSTSSASSGGDWSLEVDKSLRCNESLDETGINIPKVLDNTFEDYSSDSDIEQITTKPVQIESKGACIECQIDSNLKSSLKLRRETKNALTAAWRVMEMVTLEDRSDHEDITQQQDGTRDGRPPVPGTNISRPEDEVQDETQDETCKEEKDAHQVIQKEQSCQPLSPKNKESHSQVSPTPQKDEKGENAQVNIAIWEIAEKPLSPKNHHFRDTFPNASDLPESSQLPELNVQQDTDFKDKIPHTFINTCFGSPHNQKLPSYESGPFLDPRSNAQFKFSEENDQKIMEEIEMTKLNAEIYQTQERKNLERQKSDNQESWPMKEPEVVQVFLRTFGELGKSKILENQPSPIDNLEADKHLLNVNESERPRTMEADCITNPNKHVANIKTHIIREADKHTNIEQPIETNIVPQINSDDTQGQAKTEVEDPLDTLHKVSARNAAREPANLDDTESDDEPMDTEQIQIDIIVHKDAEGGIPEANNQTPIQLDDEKLTKLEEILHLDRETVEDIRTTLIKEKRFLEEKEAERKGYFEKKRRQKLERQNKQENAEVTPQKKLLEKRPSDSIIDASIVEESMISDKNTRSEPRTLERNAPLDLENFESSYHLENRLDELQQRLHVRAHELTDNT
ncbi:hypothetical protein JTB14_019236 [Gonioctena quinquepunctata]|nr:hypothetical protein JTB14_019236 [Gonioctena quinquepunctata]